MGAGPTLGYYRDPGSRRAVVLPYSQETPNNRACLDAALAQAADLEDGLHACRLRPARDGSSAD